MLASIDVVQLTPNGVQIGFVEKNEKAKAEGHVKGANYLPIRNFWGLPSDDEMEQIIDDAVREQSTLQESVELIDQLLNVTVQVQPPIQDDLLLVENI
jgi:hypothetical protein